MVLSTEVFPYCNTCEIEMVSSVVILRRERLRFWGNQVTGPSSANKFL